MTVSIFGGEIGGERGILSSNDGYSLPLRFTFMMMKDNPESQIVELEEKLRKAMLCSDIRVLEKLLSPGLIFTNHLGQVFSKDDDIAAHKSGLVRINSLLPSEQHILFAGGAAIVSVRMRVTGSYAGKEQEDDLRYTRVWAISPEGSWQVVAGHASAVK